MLDQYCLLEKKKTLNYRYSLFYIETYHHLNRQGCVQTLVLELGGFPCTWRSLLKKNKNHILITFF